MISVFVVVCLCKCCIYWQHTIALSYHSRSSVIPDLNGGYIEHNINLGLKLQIQITLDSDFLLASLLINPWYTCIIVNVHNFLAKPSTRGKKVLILKTNQYIWSFDIPWKYLFNKRAINHHRELNYTHVLVVRLVCD